VCRIVTAAPMEIGPVSALCASPALPQPRRRCDAEAAQRPSPRPAERRLRAGIAERGQDRRSVCNPSRPPLATAPWIHAERPGSPTMRTPRASDIAALPLPARLGRGRPGSPGPPPAGEVDRSPARRLRVPDVDGERPPPRRVRQGRLGRTAHAGPVARGLAPAGGAGGAGGAVA
jgi:hypothetical protein